MQSRSRLVRSVLNVRRSNLAPTAASGSILRHSGTAFGSSANITTSQGSIHTSSRTLTSASLSAEAQAQKTMDNFMNLTKSQGHTPEINRLTDLHMTFNDALSNKLVLAPVNWEESGKRILEAGTADGIWLRDVRSQTPGEHHYFGSDVEGELFPTKPDGITYFAHSFNDPWPAEYLNSMDLVHLRGSLAGAAPNNPYDTIKNLATIVRPGGWVQLQEMNAFSPPKNGSAMNDFAHMVSEAWTGIGVGDFANNLGDMLRQAGLQGVQERRLVIEIGKNAKPEVRENSINGVTSPVKPLSEVAKGIKTSSYTEEQLSGMQERVRQELTNEGGRIEIIIAYGQRA